ncbi:MAG: polysaccharide deacetylase family protein [Candidatus Altiarchaeota archaeon]
MIKLSADPTSPLGSFGLDHFMKKYGFPVTTGDSSIEILYQKGDVIPPKNCLHIPVQDNLIQKKLELTELDGGGVSANLDIFQKIGIELTSTSEFRKSPTSTPVEDMEARLFSKIREMCSQAGIPLAYKPFWPNGAKFALALTHDVDEVKKTYQYLTHLAKSVLRRDITAMKGQIASMKDKLTGYEPYWTFGKIKKIEEKFKCTSSLYFLQEEGKVEPTKLKSWFLAARRYSYSDEKILKVIRELDDGGWEVGLHGSYNSFADEEQLGKEKKALDEVLGRPVIGTRQHHLNLEVPKTWRIQQGIGLKYDSSLGFKDTNGFRAGTCFPFHPFDYELGRGLDILELPLTFMDTTLFSRRNEFWNVFQPLISTVEENRGLFTLLFHTSTFNNNEYPGWIEYYSGILDYARQRGAWITNGQRIAEWWIDRQNKELSLERHASEYKISCGSGLPGNQLLIQVPKDMTLSSTQKEIRIIKCSNSDVLIEPKTDEELCEVEFRLKK